jgi:hypothetical protein
VTRRAKASLFAATLIVLASAHISPAAGESLAFRQAILVIVRPTSFESLLSVGRFKELANIGGTGLMTTRAGSGDRLAAAERTIGSGRVASGYETGPTELERALTEAGLSSCESGVDGRGLPPTAPSVLGRMDVENCPILPFGDPLVPQLRVVHGDYPGASQSGIRPIEPGSSRVSGRVLIVVLAPIPSPEMDRAQDEVTPIVMAEGRPEVVLGPNGPASGPLHGLTSDSTRQDGLVSNVDVAPTILRFLGVPVPAEMDGEPIRPTSSPAPFGLHRLHLEERRTRLPVQFTVLGFVIVAFLAALGAVVVTARGSLSPPVARFVRVVALATAAIPLAALAGGRLPHFTPGYVFPFLAAATAGLTALSLAVATREPFGPFTVLGAAGLAFFVVDAALGGRAMRMPLYGGTMFDGARYYGLPNGFLPLLLGSALLVARTLTPVRGFLLLVGAGLFAGLPSLGADLGGAVTLFAAAGIWWVLRTRPRVGVQEVSLVAGVVAVGLGAVLVANRYLPGAPTHVTRFVERTGGGLGHALTVLRHRLGIGAHMVGSQPTTLVPLVGLVVVFVLALRSKGAVGRWMELDRRWRDLLLTLVAASAVAFVANDTGASAAAPAFFYAMAGIVYPAMLVAERGDRAEGTSRVLR